MLIRLHRWRRKVLVCLAALPAFQIAGGCDPTPATNMVVDQALGIASAINISIFQSFVGSIQRVILQSFPSADILQMLLGGNPSPFFP